MWNPVKELKVISYPPAELDLYLPLVESGEGIESEINRLYQYRCCAPCGIR